LKRLEEPYTIPVFIIILFGVIPGSMTNPPALAFTNGIAQSEAISIAYATVYPQAMFLRIFIAQLLILLFV